jgi:hypothetical protein
LSLSRLLRRAVVGARGQKLGQLSDVIVGLRGVDYPLVTGLVADIGGRRVFIPADTVTDWDTEQLGLSSARVDLRPFERRAGEVLLRTDILGYRLIDIPRARLVRAYDLELAQALDGWVLAGVDTRKTSWWRRALGLAAPVDDQHDSQGESEASGCRDWKAFEALIGHEPTVLLRTPTGRLRRLKPPQIADLLEQASHAEQTELLDQVCCCATAPTPTSPPCSPGCAPTTPPTPSPTSPKTAANPYWSCCPPGSAPRSPRCSATTRPAPVG